MLLGTGEPQLEASLSAAQERHPGQIAVKIGYDEPLVHLMMAACDGFIMPSRFEPCGLTQMMALRYGSLPIVSPTGGLLDTVIDATPASMAQRTATGFVMRETSVEGLREALGRAMRTCAQPPLFNAMRQAAMRQPLDWTASAQAYAALFRATSPSGVSRRPGRLCGLARRERPGVAIVLCRTSRRCPISIPSASVKMAADEMSPSSSRRRRMQCWWGHSRLELAGEGHRVRTGWCCP